MEENSCIRLKSTSLEVAGHLDDKKSDKGQEKLNSNITLCLTLLIFFTQLVGRQMTHTPVQLSYT